MNSKRLFFRADATDIDGKACQGLRAVADMLGIEMFSSAQDKGGFTVLLCSGPNCGESPDGILELLRTFCIAEGYTGEIRATYSTIRYYAHSKYTVMSGESVVSAAGISELVAKRPPSDEPPALVVDNDRAAIVKHVNGRMGSLSFTGGYQVVLEGDGFALLDIGPRIETDGDDSTVAKVCPVVRDDETLYQVYQLNALTGSGLVLLGQPERRLTEALLTMLTVPERLMIAEEVFDL